MLLPPLSLYIHIPWCVKKCPYCDFNSHALQRELPQAAYLDALVDDLRQDLAYVQDRKINSIFFGGGTPSLISPAGIENLLQNISGLVDFTSNIEITLEANPGTIEHFNFADYKTAGINRISLGAQSFNNQKLAALGRIHEAHDTLDAIEQIQRINFRSYNIDLMHGLPGQTLDEALEDLQTAIACQPPHLSWYQLTIEPNTIFYKYPPQLPTDDLAWQIQTSGEAMLAAAGYTHYEVSAFAKPDHQCMHNCNYWEYGDYLGIGAGAHGKITDVSTKAIFRTRKTRNPKDYLDPKQQYLAAKTMVKTTEIPSEFMLNRLRLFNDLSFKQFEQRTGLPISNIAAILETAQYKELIELDTDSLRLTDLGRRFLNDVMQLFC